MLRSLQVRNYVLIDSLDVTFPEGLIIITGQTGAGKSILLGALSLVLGAKADASVVGAAGDSCVVEAVLMPAADAVLREILRENEADAEGDELIVRRVVNRTGRSRSFLNDAPVTLPVLASIATHLVDIHSQHQTLRLADPAFQLGVLDLYAGDSEALSACRTAWKTLRELESEAKDLEERIRRSEASSTVWRRPPCKPGSWRNWRPSSSGWPMPKRCGKPFQRPRTPFLRRTNPSLRWMYP